MKVYLVKEKLSFRKFSGSKSELLKLDDGVSSNRILVFDMLDEYDDYKSQTRVKCLYNQNKDMVGAMLVEDYDMPEWLESASKLIEDFDKDNSICYIIATIIVGKQYRKCGYGKEMIERYSKQLIKESPKRYSKVYLFADIYSSAKGFYTSLGFKQEKSSMYYKQIK